MYLVIGTHICDTDCNGRVSVAGQFDTAADALAYAEDLNFGIDDTSFPYDQFMYVEIDPSARGRFDTPMYTV